MSTDTSKPAVTPAVPAPAVAAAEGDAGKIAALEALVAELKQKLESLQGNYDAALVDKQNMEKEKKLSETKAVFDKLLSEGKVCEAQRESYIAGDVVKFSELAKPVKLEAVGSGVPAPATVSITSKTDAEDKVIELAEKRVKAGEFKSMDEAISRILRDDSELRKLVEG